MPGIPGITSVNSVRGCLEVEALGAPGPGPLTPEVGVLVLGSGSIGMRHLGVLTDLPGVDVEVAPIRGERRMELAALGYRLAPPSYLDRAAGRAVVIATDTARHARDLEEVVEAGAAAVLVEKPLAASLKDLREARHLIEQAPVPVFVGCCLRFDMGLAAFRERLPALGKVYDVDVEARSYLPDWRPDRDYRYSYSAREGEGGVLLDLIHEIDYSTWLFGRPSRVAADLSHTGLLGIDSEDRACLRWQTESNVGVTLHLDYLCRVPVRRMTAYGSEGTMTWDFLSRSVTLRLAGQEPLQSVAAGERGDLYRDQMRAFLGVARGCAGGPLATGLEGARAVALCDAARRSSASGKTEEVTLW